MSPSEDKPLLCSLRALPASPHQHLICVRAQPPSRFLLMSNLNLSCCRAPSLGFSASSLVSVQHNRPDSSHLLPSRQPP